MIYGTSQRVHTYPNRQSSLERQLKVKQSSVGAVKIALQRPSGQPLTRMAIHAKDKSHHREIEVENR